MIGIAWPSLLVGGVAGAAIALILHLLARTPPTREPLPTARFLTRDARTLLRIRQRPTDVPLLVVRVAFITVLAAAFAGLTWTGTRDGTARIILLDAGADTLADWDARVEEARRLVAVVTPAEEQQGAEPVIVAYGLDAGYRIVDTAGLDRLIRGSEPASAQDGLRALRTVAAGGTWDRAGAVWLTRPAWRAWTPDLGLLRADIWPGRAMLSETSTPAAVGPPAESGGVSPEEGPAAGATSVEGIVAWIFPEAVGTPLEAALRALGVTPRTGAEAGSNPAWIIAHDVTAEAATAFMDRAREGSSVVVSGRLPDGVVGLPWTVSATRTTADTALSGIVVPWGAPAVGEAVARLPGNPSEGARVVAVFEDALPAAAAVRLGRGCVTYLAANLLDESLTGSDGFPLLVESLASACADVTSGDTPLDEGAVHVLQRPDLPATVDVAALGGTGTPLTRWLLILAFLLLLAEIGMTRQRPI